ncbi:MAG: type II secretion system protein GspE, partial [Gemmatimonadales bacterium]
MANNVVQDRLGDLFVREGLITKEQLQEALKEAQQSKTRLGFALVKMGFVAENQLTRALAKQFRVPAVDLDKVKVEEKILKLVPEEVAMKHRVLPLRKVGRTLTVAMANPTDMGAIDNLKFITRYEIEPVIVGEYTLQKHLEDYYGLGEMKMQEMLGDLLDEEVEVLEDREEDISVAALEAEVDKAPVVKFINGLLTDAVLKGVSDIHIEPYEQEVRIRYRID